MAFCTNIGTVRLLSLSLVLTSSLFGICSAEIFTSMADVEKLLAASSISELDWLTKYFDSEHQQMDVLREKLRQYQIYRKSLFKDGKMVTDAVSLYVFIKRMVETIGLAKTDEKRVNEALEQFQNETGHSLPTEEDVIGAATALFRLQDTYNLKASDIADGHLFGDDSSAKLSALDCFDLGKVAYDYDESDYYHTVIWMMEADRRLRKENPKTVARADILDYLSYSLYQQDNLARAYLLSKQLQRLDPGRNLINENVAFYRDQLAESGIDADDVNEKSLPPLRVRRHLVENKPKFFFLYEKLCRGEFQKSEEEKAKLYCYYKRNNAFLKLARLKVEIVHLQPRIAIFRNVISDAESEQIRELAEPKFTRAQIVKLSGKFDKSDHRISKIAWLMDEEHTLVDTLSKRVEQMSDLTSETAEFLQISNYGIGGHYEPHFDFAPTDGSNPMERKTFDAWGAGNRIATILFYLSQPKAGGATVFMDLKLTVQATKNDAVLWYNLFRNGQGDVSLRHAACPVLSGVKWVANKWLHEYGQEFRRPCLRDKNL